MRLIGVRRIGDRGKPLGFQAFAAFLFLFGIPGGDGLLFFTTLLVLSGKAGGAFGLLGHLSGQCFLLLECGFLHAQDTAAPFLAVDAKLFREGDAIPPQGAEITVQER